jgi:predicted SAM-dependent methyltransferase
MQKKLNVGCGARFLEDWENIDFVSNSKHVRQHDLTTGLPYPDCAFDVVYSSHVIEHLTLPQLRDFLAECHRVLKPEGILRLVFPDLEEIARNYIQSLDQVRSTKTDLTLKKYEWSKIELIDQMARQSSGGEYIAFLKKYRETDWSWLETRVGFEAAQMGSPQPRKSASKPSLRIRLACLKHKLLFKMTCWLLGDSRAKEKYLAGNFALSGELHKWMHDEISITTHLQSAGFRNVHRCQVRESSISTWPSQDDWLDLEGGQVRKPDSIFVEATK